MTHRFCFSVAGVVKFTRREAKKEVVINHIFLRRVQLAVLE